MKSMGLVSPSSMGGKLLVVLLGFMLSTTFGESFDMEGNTLLNNINQVRQRLPLIFIRKLKFIQGFFCEKLGAGTHRLKLFVNTF